MGFLDNLGNEFGRKTGKALGNKLYGRHADDLRIGSSAQTSYERSSSSSIGQDFTDYEAIERAKRKTMEYEQNAQFLEDIIRIEFDSSNKESIIKELTTLASYIDLWLKGGAKKNLNVAKSKFDSGLAILTAIDPKNPMITFFTNKKADWTNYAVQKRNKTLIIVGTIVLIVLVGLMILL